MLGEKFEIEVEFGLETEKVLAEVIEYIDNDIYILKCNNGNRYLRKLVWENPSELCVPFSKENLDSLYDIVYNVE